MPDSREFANEKSGERRDKIPDPTISRLPLYFRCLSDLCEKQITVVSSDEIANRAGVKASQFRKDLSYFGEFGVQGLGYPVPHLLRRIGSIMQLDRVHKVALIGAGNLGSALAGFGGFARWGFHILWIFDSSPERIGLTMQQIVVEDVNSLPKPLAADVGIIAVPMPAAQRAADLLVASGVKAILNFTGATLNAPSEIVLRNVDLTHELAILAYHLSAPQVEHDSVEAET
jgi:redox-sensing transcriptional repressor